MEDRRREAQGQGECQLSVAGLVGHGWPRCCAEARHVGQRSEPAVGLKRCNAWLSSAVPCCTAAPLTDAMLQTCTDEQGTRRN